MSFPPQFEAPTPEELNELLTAYDVSDFIAKGGMGAVYKAHQRSLERDVAVKILPREFGEDEEFRRRFEDEAKAMAKLNHPNLIGVYDFGEVDSMPYIVMEFVDGKSLHHSAHGRAIDQKEAARLVSGICEGLGHAHEAGILHRDIKPANILLDSRKRPKIGDFGLARAADSTEGEGIVFGTPDYSAPEVHKDDDVVDARSDVYSIGVILYELLTGKLPEKNYVPASQAEDVDPRFDKIIRRATHPSPTLRYADAGAMAKEIKALCEALDRPGASIVTRAPGSKASPPAAVQVTRQAAQPSGAPAAPAASAPPSPQVSVSTGPNWSLLRNLVIIVVLGAAIYGMYRAYEWKKKDIVREKERQEQLEQEREIVEAAEEIRLKKERERQLSKGPDVVRPVYVPEETEPETPSEALARLKPILAGGEREEFPPGTEKRGTSRFFLVETPMSWQRAAAFAEEHGGHLATLINEGEKNWLSSKIPDDTTVWLGGGATGRSDWGWVDATPWEVRKPSTSTGNSATLSHLGSIRSKPGGDKFPFFIQWRGDGSNPGSLAAQLERLKESLDEPEPDYPPGVLSFGSRRYLVIEKSVTWNEAASVARSAFGHLAVPSEPLEGEFLQKSVSETLAPGEAAWIGGQHNGRAWAWTTGEPWTVAEWVEGSPDGDEASDTAVRLVAGPEGGWDDADPADSEAASAFIIEWSKDRSSTPVAVNPGAGGDWTGVRAATLKRARVLEGQFAKALAENGKGLKWDLDFWMRTLRETESKGYAATVTQLKSQVQDDGSIDIKKDQEIFLPQRGQTIVRSHLQKEEALRATFLRELDKIRQSYIDALEQKKVTAQGSGLTNQVRAIENEIEASGDDPQSFRTHLGLGS